MIKKWFGILALIGALQSVPAQACSPLPLYDYETGRPYAYYFYSGPALPNILGYKSEAVFIAIAKAKVVESETLESFTGEEYERQTVRFKIREILKGDIDEISERSLPSDPSFDDAEIKAPVLDFKFWENNRLSERITFNGSIADSCGRRAGLPSVQDKQLYLVFGQQGENFNFANNLVPILSKKSELVQAFRKIGRDAPDAPHKYSTSDYFSNMRGYAEIGVLECPVLPTDFLYEDSRFTGPKRQKGKLYTISDSYNLEAIDFMDVIQYSGRQKRKKFECEFGDRYLVIFSNFPKFLKIENGQINTKHIITGIDIQGDPMVQVSSVKTWIKAGAQEDAAE